MYRVPHIFCASLFHAPHCLNIDSLNSPTTEHFHLKVAINDSNFTQQFEVKMNRNPDLLFAHLAISRPRLPRRDLPCLAPRGPLEILHGNVLCFVQHVDYGGAKEAQAREAAGGRGLCRVRVRQYTHTPHLGGRLHGCTAFYPPPRPQRERERRRGREKNEHIERSKN